MLGKNSFLLLMILLTGLIVFGACNKPSQPPPPPHDHSSDHAQMPMPSQPGEQAQMPPPGMVSKSPTGGLPVVVPEDVASKYKAVKLRLQKKEGGFDQTFEIPIGGESKLGDTGLSVKVLYFLPGFLMEQARITSVGAEETNPAAKVAVTENEKPIHTGWLFAKMPTVHAFPHQVYSLTLVEGVKK